MIFLKKIEGINKNVKTLYMHRTLQFDQGG